MPDHVINSPLQDVLAERNKPLAEETAQLVKEIQPLLWHTLSTFPSGTSHTPEHTATVEQIASMVIPDKMLSQLNDDELQLLILGCHYHDLAMAGTEAENSDQEAQDQARKDHAIRIGERLKEKWQELGFRDLALAEALAEVCRGHRPPKENGVASWNSIRRTTVIGPDRSVRIRIISALVYVADELHIGADRASAKEEDWLQISNDESRRHWKRHQFIKGPALVDGHLHLEISPPTIVLESDLKEQVLQKALSALRDGQSLLQSEEIQYKLTSISLTWHRESLWTLLLISELSDLIPRTRNQISEAIYNRYDSEVEKFCDLSSLVQTESSSSKELHNEIDRIIGDFCCRGHLNAKNEDQPESLSLNTELTTAKRFFEIAKQGDDLDVLFSGRYAAHHDFELQRSEYGIKHSELSVEPLIRASYGIQSSPEGVTPIAALLRSSPTARHLAIEGAPAPSILSKPHALALAVLSGASLDLLRAPELMLDQEFRNAYKDLTSLVSNEQPRFTRFVEELALVDGYSYEQLHEAMTFSEQAHAAFNASIGADGSSAEGNSKLTITQQIPTKLRPISVSFPHLHLAGQRAKITVHIVNTEEAPISVKGNMPNEQDSEWEMASLAFSPGEGRLPPTIAQRADFDLDEENRQLRITICTNSLFLNREAPLLMRVSTSDLISSKKTNISFSFYWPSLTARHWRCFASIKRLAKSGKISAIISVKNGNGMKGMAESLEPNQIESWCVEIEDPEFVEFLYTKGKSTPFPYWLPADVKEAIESRSTEQWNAVFDQYSQKSIKDKFVVSSVTMRTARQDNTDYQDEYLGFYPGFDLGPPQVSDESNMSQEKINRLWEDGEKDCMLASSFSSDEHELAQIMRSWFEDQSQPFPIEVTGDPPGTPVFRSRIEIIRGPIIDRLWYVERPYTFRFRPINDEERWNVEGSYWQSKGDQGREAIIKERLSALRAENEANKESTAPEQLPPQNLSENLKREPFSKSKKSNKKRKNKARRKEKKWKKRK